MMYYNILIIILLLLRIIKCICKSDSILIDTPLHIPKYCIDNKSIEIFSKRLSCLSNSYSNDKTILSNPLVKELQLLRNTNTSEYTRAHELLAYLYYIDSNNSYRVDNCNDADMEYIPLIPLNWKIGKPSLSSQCSYSVFMQDILAFMKHYKSRPIVSRSIPLFTVVSTFNFRTAMGAGMPTQVRRGEAWNTISEWTQLVYIGHYERWPQCPDLLRKSWKHVIELPYIPLSSIFHVNEKVPNSLSSVLLPEKMHDKNSIDFMQNILSEKKKKITFSFTGRKLLWGPETICSVRTAINNIRGNCLLSSSSSFTSLNVTAEQSYSKVNDDILDVVKKSTFCLIGKADSYSTSSFYTALQSLCIPIVISDWYVFAFPSFIPWETFVIRLDEEVFQKCAECCLQKILEYYQQNPSKLDDMHNALLKWIGLISYEQVPYNSLWRSFQQALYNVNDNVNVNSKSNMMTVIPFELMMLEIKHVHNMFINSSSISSSSSSSSSKYFNKCESPHYCSTNGGWQVKSFIDLHKYVIPDERSNLCKRVGGLIGHYKIVYFMQCVRILWPLHPGKMIKQDLVPPLPVEIKRNKDCSSRSSVLSTGLTDLEKNTVFSFHQLHNKSLPYYFTWPKNS